MILQSFQTQSAELLSTGQAQHAACSPNQIHFPAPFPPPLTPVQPLSPPSATPRHPDAASAKPCLSQLPPNPHATPVTPFRYPSPSRCCTSKALPKPVAFQTPLQPLSPPGPTPRHLDAATAKPCPSQSPTWPVEADCALRSQHTCMHSLLGSDGFGHACLPCFKAAQSNAHTSLNMSWKVEEEEVTGESHQLRPANKAVPIMATMSHVHEI